MLIATHIMAKTQLFVKIVFGVVLAILITSFVNVGISLFYPEPEYDDFCDIYPRPITDETPEEKVEELNREQKKCSDEFEADNKKYGRTVFFILAPSGILLLIIGAFVSTLTLQIMLMGAGFLNVVIGIMRNIQDKPSVFITIGILIVILVLFVLKKLRD